MYKNLPLGRLGNKKNDIKYFKKYLPLDVETVIEPFAGTFAVIRMIYNDPKYKKHINDLDMEWINVLTESQEKYEEIEKFFMLKLWKTGDKKEKLYEAIDQSNFSVSLKSAMKKHFSMHGAIKGPPQKCKYGDVAKLFKSCNVTSDDGIEVMNQYVNDETAFIFVDPPYFDSFNNNYKTKMKINNQLKNDYSAIYLKLLEFLKICKCKVLFTINSTALIEYIFKDFIIDKYQKIYGSSLRETILVIGSNIGPN